MFEKVSSERMNREQSDIFFANFCKYIPHVRQFHLKSGIKLPAGS